MAKYRVKAQWMVSAEYNVEAESPAEAEERAMQSVLPLAPPRYVDDSWKCDPPQLLEKGGVPFQP